MEIAEILQKMWNTSRTMSYADWLCLRAFRHQLGLLDESDFPAVIADMKLRGFTHLAVEEFPIRECLLDDPFSYNKKLVDLNSDDAIKYVEKRYKSRYHYYP